MRIVARFGGSGSRLRRYVVFSLVAHAFFIAAVLLMPSFRTRAELPDNPIMVSLVAPSRPTARVQAPAPSVPEETAPPEGVRVETKVPVPKPLPEKPKKREKKPERPKPKPRRTPPAESAPTSGPTGPEPSQPAGASIGVLETGDVEFAWYRSSVTAALYSQWRRPILEAVNETFEVTVTFEILRDGSVTRLKIESPSGVPSLDRSAVRAVSDASPLPPLPANWRSAQLPATYVFRLHPE